MLYSRTTKSTPWLLFAAAVIAFLSLSSTVSAQDTLLINYQGRLTDNSGSPLTGNYDLTFGIYAMPVGPSQLWSETHSDVPVTDGLFTVILGSSNTLPDTVFGGTDRYLGIAVGTDPEISPRSLMTSVPSAAYAKKVTGDIATSDGMLVMKDISGDSTIVMNSGLADNVARIYLIEPGDDNAKKLEFLADNQGALVTLFGTPNDSAIVLRSDIISDLASMYLIEPGNDNVHKLELNTGSDGSSINMYSSEVSNYGDKIFELSNTPSGISNIKMFNPQPEPPAVQFEINASSTDGAGINIYDDIGQVMGFGPSPFNEAYSIYLVDPDDNEKQIEMIANHITDVASIKLIEPGDDGVTPAIEMTSGPLGSYFNINGYDQTYSMSHNAFSVDVDNIDLVTNVKMIEPGNDVTPGFHFTADGMSNLASLRLLDPANNDNSLIEVNGGTLAGSIKMFNPQPEPPAVQFEINASSTEGAGINIYDDFGQVMGVEPSPFNGGYAIKLIDPGDDGELVGLSSSYSGKGGSGKVSVYDNVSMLESHLEPAALTLQYNPVGASGPPIKLTATDANAYAGIGVSNPSEPLVVGKDLGAWAGNRIVVGDDTPGSYTGLVIGEDHTTRAHFTWNINDNFMGIGIEEGGTHYSNMICLRGGNVGINTNTPSTDLYVSGNICYTGSIGACSDIRYKRNIHTLGKALEKVSKLRGISFEWRQDEYPEQKFSSAEQIGLIAQEVRDVVPEIVSETDDGYYNVDYTKLTPLLIEAIKELKAENEELRSRLDRLESR